MNIDFLIKKLEEQKDKVNEGNPEVWLNTTYAFIEDFFSSTSTRARSFNSIINNFTTKKIFGISNNEVEYIKNQAVEYINELIIYLKELKIKKEEEIKIEKKNNIENNKSKPKQENIVKTVTIHKTELPFGIAPGLFWTVLAGVVTAAFVLGQNFGSTKFDKEKSDYYEEIKVLQKDTINLNNIIKEKDSILREKDDAIIIKSDSLKVINEKIDNLYLLLAKHIKN
jgi:hypothetical protein